MTNTSSFVHNENKHRYGRLGWYTGVTLSPVVLAAGLFGYGHYRSASNETAIEQTESALYGAMPKDAMKQCLASDRGMQDLLSGLASAREITCNVRKNPGGGTVYDFHAHLPSPENFENAVRGIKDETPSKNWIDVSITVPQHSAGGTTPLTTISTFAAGKDINFRSTILTLDKQGAVVRIRTDERSPSLLGSDTTASGSNDPKLPEDYRQRLKDITEMAEILRTQTPKAAPK